MTVRPFDWRDLPVLHRYRNRCIFLDSTRLFTQGPRIVSVGALFSYFALVTGIFTFRTKEKGLNRQVILGQVIHPAGDPSAHISFLAPESAIHSASLPELLEQLSVHAAQRGAYNLLADVDEDGEAFDTLRKLGFGIYARQRLWLLAGDPHCEGILTPWRSGNSQDTVAVRSLYCNLVPGLVQQVEPPPNHRLRGLVYRAADELLAYVELRYGPEGIWAQPFIHPDIEKASQRLAHLLCNLPYRRARPVYLCIRSYQSWLEPAIGDLGAVPGPHHAVMVKRLAVPLKNARSIMMPALERGHPEVSAPMTQTKSN